MRSHGYCGILLAITVLVGGRATSAELPKTDIKELTAAYETLLAVFPEDNQGLGDDYYQSAHAEQPMTYGFVLSAEAIHLKHAPNDESRRRVRKAVQWLLDNRDLDGDGKPGWGLPQAWDAWGDDTTNPPNQPYTITTAIVLNGLLDALQVPDFWTAAERNEIRDVIGKVVTRWCNEVWSKGYGGGYFWYSPRKVDDVFGINATVMFLGSLVRVLHEQPDLLTPEEKRLAQDRADELAKATVATLEPRAGMPFWRYAPLPNRVNITFTNDLVHQVYILLGIEVYRDLGGKVHLPWTRAQAIQSIDCYWKDGIMCQFPQDPGAKDEEPSVSTARLWSAGMMLAFYAKWGTDEQVVKTFKAIDKAHGPWPKLRWESKESRAKEAYYPRDTAHLLYGMAIYCFEPRK
jgi:hypothetical protein